MLCGYDVPESVVSLGREMLVTFKSDNVLSYEGFQASFVFLDESNLPPTSKIVFFIAIIDVVFLRHL